MMPTSIQSTHLFHRRRTAAISPRKGTTTPIMLALRSALVMRCRLARVAWSFLSIFRAESGPLLSRGYDSVERGIGRHRGEERELPPHPAQHRGPQALGVLAEQLLALRILDDPRLLGDLGLELSGSPAGVARVHARPAHPPASCASPGTKPRSGS